MTMYLPNGEVRPTGYEAGEFLEDPTVVPPPEDEPGPPGEGDDRERRIPS